MGHSRALARTAFGFAVFAFAACGKTKSAATTDAGSIDATSNAAFDACVLAEACGGGPWLRWSTQGIDGCYSDLLAATVSTADEAPPEYNGLTLQAFVACAAGTTSCASWFACTTPGHDPAYCAAHPLGSCDGTVAVNCASATVGGAVQACPSGRFACRIEKTLALCSDGTTCSGPYSPEGCVGNVATGCSDTGSGTGFETGDDCAQTKCVSGGEPGPLIAGCAIPTGNTNVDCTSGTGCQGDVAVECPSPFGDVFGASSEDCGAIDAHCDASGAPGALFGYCYSNATECPDGAAPSCTGTNYIACVNGRNTTFDCASIGLTCTPNGCG